jgi:dolichol-phosphate mannosyltransferase
VIIPTYNEKENAEKIIKAVLKVCDNADVLIVDDNSPDGTAQIVRDMQKETARIHLIEREGKLGLGTAYVRGFKFGVEQGYDFIFEMDADFSHDPKDLQSRGFCSAILPISTHALQRVFPSGT